MSQKAILFYLKTFHQSFRLKLKHRTEEEEQVQQKFYHIHFTKINCEPLHAVDNCRHGNKSGRGRDDGEDDDVISTIDSDSEKSARLNVIYICDELSVYR